LRNSEIFRVAIQNTDFTITNHGFKYAFDISRFAMKALWRTVVLLGIVSLLTDMSSEMIIPVLPIFLVTALCASPLIVGLIEGFANSLASILKVISGYVSDRMGRPKPLIIGGYTLSGISKLFLGFSRWWSDVFALRLLDRGGKGVRSAPRDAVIASSTDMDKRGRAFGLHRAMDTTGAIIGPLILIVLLPLFGYRDIFIIAAVPALIAVTFLFFLKEPQMAKEKPKSIKISFKKIPKQLKFFILVSTIFALGNFSYAFFILKVLDAGFNPMDIIYLYLLFNIVYAATSIPMGALSDKVGRKPVISFSYLLFGITCLGFMFSSTVVHFVILFILYGLFNAGAESCQRAYISDLAPEELRATALGTFHTAVGVAMLPSSIIAGLLWSYIGLGAMFMFGVVLALTALTIFLLKKDAPASPNSDDRTANP
jgi:MFS family permease